GWERTPERFCEQPARGMGWLWADGTMGFVRCGAPNRCDYCAMLTACENAVVLRLDAFDGEQPTVGITTTTRKLGVDLGSLRVGEAQLWKRLRREHGRVEYCGFLEWSTGDWTPGRR